MPFAPLPAHGDGSRALHPGRRSSPAPNVTWDADDVGAEIASAPTAARPSPSTAGVPS